MPIGSCDWGQANWVAVIVAVVAHQVLGMLWYGPLFGKRWRAAIDKTPEEMGAPTQAIAVGVVCSVLAAVFLEFLLGTCLLVDMGQGITWGLIIGVAFVGSAIVTNAVFEGKPWSLTWLYAGYQVVGFTLMGGLLGFFHANGYFV